MPNTSPPAHRIFLASFSMLALIFLTGVAQVEAQALPDFTSRSTGAVRQASLSSDEGIVAARLDATRARQIRVTVKFLMLDDQTRKDIYQQLDHASIKTTCSKLSESPVPSTTPQGVSSAECSEVIDTTSHVSTCVLEQASSDRILAMIEESPTSLLGKTPSILLLEGREAEYSDIIQRPFVVNIERTESGPNPVFKVLDEGTKIHLRAKLSDSSPDTAQRIQLEGAFKWHKILDVKSREIFGIDEASATVQLPAHVTKTVSAAAELAEGQSLLVDPYIQQITVHSTESGVPVLRKLPYLSRSFKNVAAATVEQHVMILLKPAIE